VTILHHLAQAAAVILLIELLVILLIFLGIAGGLAFGLHWVRGKTGWVFEKINGYASLATKYTRVGTEFVAKPFILGAGAVTRVRVTLEAIRRQFRAIRASPGGLEPSITASRSFDPEVTTAVPAVPDATVVTPAVVESAPRP
jgi:hypothetical protein